MVGLPCSEDKAFVPNMLTRDSSVYIYYMIRFSGMKAKFGPTIFIQLNIRTKVWELGFQCPDKAGDNDIAPPSDLHASSTSFFTKL